MTVKPIKTIVLIGAGNLATHLAVTFNDTGKKILQVYSRTEKSAKELAEKIKVPYTCDLKKIITGADLYIISVSDAALPGIAKQLSIKSGMVAHTSGFHEMDFIKDVSENIGVFYPLQTFSKNRKIDFNTIPFCIESNSEDSNKLLENLARSFTKDVRYINSSQRKMIHLAAVFACNFTNQMYQVAEEILKKSSVPFDILQPLIKETADKVMEINPLDSQTGPARRNDIEVMQQHLKMLDNDDYRKLYENISELIMKRYNK